MTKNRVTIKDIARELKISTSTVSRALADKWDVNPETRKAVMELSEKLNYRPNQISLNLKKQQSMTVGIVIPEFINAFFPEVIIGIESVLRPQGYQMLICQSNESPETELANIRMLENKMVDGFIISMSAETSDPACFNTLAESGPVVFFNRICPGTSASSVVIDDRKWAFLATEHLIEQGCRRIVHLAGPENLEVAIRRRQGYLDALAAHGLEQDPELVIPCGVMMERGVMGAYRILELEQRPDGIFAFNDPVAVGAMKTLQKRGGVRIPEEMAVVGFTESKMAVIIEPNLTSVEQPTFEMGKAVAELLLEQLRNKTDEKRACKTIILDAKLNVRESSSLNPASDEETPNT